MLKKEPKEQKETEVTVSSSNAYANTRHLNPEESSTIHKNCTTSTPEALK